MIEGVDRMIMQGIAATKRLPLPRELALQVMAMPESDQKTLEFFAPYAASYLPEVEKYARPVLAGLFVAFWGMSIVGRTKALESVSKEYIAHLEKQRTTGNATPV
jgi:hypothetical protein